MRQDGMILLPVLIVLLFVSSAILIELDEVGLQSHIQRSMQLKWENQILAEKIIVQLKPSSVCSLSYIPVAYLTEMNSTWWHRSQLCQLHQGKKMVRYFFTQLSDDNYLITLRVDFSDHAPVLLQIIKSFPDDHGGGKMRAWRRLS